MRILTLVNRTKKDIEFTYDSISYKVKPDKPLNVPDHIAQHAWYKSIAKLDPITGEALYLLGVKDEEGNELTPCDELDYEKKKNEELLDRTNMDGNFKEVGFNNPNESKARVVPIQMAGAFSDVVGGGQPEPVNLEGSNEE